MSDDHEEHMRAYRQAIEDEPAERITSEAMAAHIELHRAVWAAGREAIAPARYLDPAILRGPATPAPSTAPIVRLHVPEPLHDHALGDRVEISSSSVDQRLRRLTIITRWATVVSWDRDSGELVVQPDER